MHQIGFTKWVNTLAAGTTMSITADEHTEWSWTKSICHENNEWIRCVDCERDIYLVSCIRFAHLCPYLWVFNWFLLQRYQLPIRTHTCLRNVFTHKINNFRTNKKNHFTVDTRALRGSLLFVNNVVLGGVAVNQGHSNRHVTIQST